MPTVEDFRRYLEAFAPLPLAETWDNVGLLVGSDQQQVERVMTCLTITPESLDEARNRQANLIVTHHPLPFRPLQKITTDSTTGTLILRAVRDGISIFSPHTAFDSAGQGINQQLAVGIGLTKVRPLSESTVLPGLGTGRIGTTAPNSTVSSLVQEIKKFLAIDQLQAVGQPSMAIQTVAVGCGSGGSLLESARRAGCELLVTGEASFHTCLEAKANGMAMILTGHFASERFAVVKLAELLAAQFSQTVVWASRDEADPLRYV
ncbi:MAG: Nif3-like dinuclear metal center hexameric protein [Planctomycetes bacterium]|nr:Nif3-like dinuclear metal center hexameric protein [Planctomycetota bacterium]